MAGLLSATLGGTPLTFPSVSARGFTPINVVATGPSTQFTVSGAFEGTYPRLFEVIVSVPVGATTGTLDCGATTSPASLQLDYMDAFGEFKTTGDVGQCRGTFSMIPTTAGQRLVGTFAGTPPADPPAPGTNTLDVADGMIDVLVDDFQKL
jgi:hypothetical protein